ncbi:hypothetical protein ACJX0J_012825 [Zea mays]
MTDLNILCLNLPLHSEFVLITLGDRDHVDSLVAIKVLGHVHGHERTQIYHLQMHHQVTHFIFHILNLVAVVNRFCMWYYIVHALYLFRFTYVPWSCINIIIFILYVNYKS